MICRQTLIWHHRQSPGFETGELPSLRRRRVRSSFQESPLPWRLGRDVQARRLPGDSPATHCARRCLVRSPPDRECRPSDPAGLRRQPETVRCDHPSSIAPIRWPCDDHLCAAGQSTDCGIAKAVPLGIHHWFAHRHRWFHWSQSFHGDHAGASITCSHVSHHVVSSLR